MSLSSRNRAKQASLLSHAMAMQSAAQARINIPRGCTLIYCLFTYVSNGDSMCCSEAETAWLDHRSKGLALTITHAGEYSTPSSKLAIDLSSVCGSVIPPALPGYWLIDQHSTPLFAWAKPRFQSYKAVSGNNHGWHKHALETTCYSLNMSAAGSARATKCCEHQSGL